MSFGGFFSAPFISVALIKQFVADVAWGDLDFLIVDTPPGTSDEHISTVEALRPYKPLGAILVTTPQVVQPAGAELEFPGGLLPLGVVWGGICTPGWVFAQACPWLLVLHICLSFDACPLQTHGPSGQTDTPNLPCPPPQAVSVGDVRRELTFCKKTGLRVLGIVENMSGFVCPHCSVSLLGPLGYHGFSFVTGRCRMQCLGWKMGKRHEGDAVSRADEKLLAAARQLWKKPLALRSQRELGEGRGKGSTPRLEGGGELALLMGRQRLPRHTGLWGL